MSEINYTSWKYINLPQSEKDLMERVQQLEAELAGANDAIDHACDYLLRFEASEDFKDVTHAALSLRQWKEKNK